MPDERRINITQTNNLGHRLRHEGITPDDRERFEWLLSDCFGVLLEVQADLRKAMPAIAFTPRLKTVDTIIDKLRRERTMALSRMRDIAGMRIVEQMNRVQQDVLVREVHQAIGGGLIVDRRKRPTFGYRAVHIEHQRRGIYVEVQVRTTMQDQWAQIVERLADSWGRQVRYGGGPPEPKREIIASVTRADLWALTQGLSEQIDIVERDEASGAYDASEAGGRAALISETAKRELKETLDRMYRIAGADWV